MDTVEPFANRLRRTRNERGLSQDDLARAVKVSKNTVVRWEHGRIPRPAHLYSVADALGVSARWLLNGGDREVAA